MGTATDDFFVEPVPVDVTARDEDPIAQALLEHEEVANELRGIAVGVPSPQLGAIPDSHPWPTEEPGRHQQVRTTRATTPDGR